MINSINTQNISSAINISISEQSSTQDMAVKMFTDLSSWEFWAFMAGCGLACFCCIAFALHNSCNNRRSDYESLPSYNPRYPVRSH